MHAGRIRLTKDRIRRERHRYEERQYNDEGQKSARQRMHHG
jgi:hypothetical protein